ncbi:hypothetical protein ABE493_16250 [Stenotrophomonas terrae]|uniref:hypothetical protein n=1 Tax=Stenotrophomonas terrae TaxID=405446 RepID=UPI0032082D77
MIRLFAVPTAVLLLSACSSAYVNNVQPIDGVVSGQCHTDMVRGAVGLAASPDTVQRARVDSDSLQVDVVRGNDSPETAASLGTQASSGGERLTIEVGRTNNITAMRCG